jgi:hypothetical protein
MEITTINITPNSNCLEPEFYITVNYTQDECRIPVKALCFVLLDRTRIAFMQEYAARGGNIDSLTWNKSEKGPARKAAINFLAPLSRIALSKIEDARHRNNGDAVLRIQTEFTCVEPVFGVLKNKVTPKKIYDMPYLKNETLIQYKTYYSNDEVRIPQSVWVSKFLPVFENKKYQLIELPIPQFTGGDENLHKRIDAAIKCIPKMEAARNNGEWSEVIDKSRKIWELINDKGSIETLFNNADMDAEAIDTFKTFIDQLYKLGCKFNHTVDKKRTNPMKENHASKEDAELIYTVSLSLLNFVSRKV